MKHILQFVELSLYGWADLIGILVGLDYVIVFLSGDLSMGSGLHVRCSILLVCSPSSVLDRPLGHGSFPAFRTQKKLAVLAIGSLG